MIHIKKTLRCSATKTVSDEEKTAAAERTFRKTFKEEKIDVDEKRKENNVTDIKEDTEAFKLTHCWKLGSKLNFNIQYNT